MIYRKPRTALAGMVLFAGFTTAALSQVVVQKEDFDNYHLRIEAGWYYSDPSGNIHGSTTTDKGTAVDLQRDLGFQSYSTVSGKVDWKFTRKNHFYVTVTPFNFSRQKVLDRTFTFQGQTFNAGLTTSSSLDTLFVAPGYQYDIIRRRRGHLGIGIQMDLFNTNAKINAAAQVTGDGVHHSAVSASGSLLAPIPVAGPDFRLYLTNSPRVFIQGNVFGMYLFGYGNFVSTAGNVGITLSKHFSALAGYQLASHLIVNDATDRIGLRFVQKGAVVGLETSF
jgi:hypothetical protein